MATIEKYIIGSIATLMGAELNSLASSSTLAAGATTAGATGAFNNTAGATGDGYVLGECELSVNYGSSTTPAAGSAAYVYFLADVDGTNYEYGDATHIPARPPDVVFPFPNVAFTTAYKVTIKGVAAPPGSFQTVLTQNTGAAFPATTNTLKWLPYTRQGV